MKNLSQFVLSILLFISLASSFKSYGGTILGGDIIYIHQRNLTYRVYLRLFTDCADNRLGTEKIEVRAGRCGPSMVTVAPIPVLRVDTQQIYHQNYPAYYRCTSGVNPSYPILPTSVLVHTFNFNITLPSRRADWCFVYSDGNRPRSANIAFGSPSTVYLEAILNNLDFAQNNSPVFNQAIPPCPRVPFYQQYSHSMRAFDYDGDSLVYTLEAPRTTCNTNATYANYTGGAVVDTTVIPNTSGRYGPGSYSSNFPIASFQPVANNSNAIPDVQFDNSTGVFSFRPSKFGGFQRFPAPDNQFSIFCRVKEYRRNLNGNMVLAGEIGREFIVFVYVLDGNRLPYFSPSETKRMNNYIQRIAIEDSGTIAINVSACNRNRSIYLKFNDPNIGSLLNFLDGRDDLIPQSNQTFFNASIGFNNSTTLSWSDTTFNGPSLEIKKTIFVRDNNFPVFGNRSYLFKITLNKDSTSESLRAIDDTLIARCYNTSKYQWYLDGVLLQNDTSCRLVTQRNGNYMARAFDGVCVRNYYYNLTHLSTAQLLSQITLYPNPASQLTKIKAPAEIWTKVQSVEVVNALGQVVLSQPAQQDDDGQMTLPLTGLKSGYYWLRFGGLGVGKALVVE